MDPNAAWRYIEETLLKVKRSEANHDDVEYALDRALDLKSWMIAGGFDPRGCSGLDDVRQAINKLRAARSSRKRSA